MRSTMGWWSGRGSFVATHRTAHDSGAPSYASAVVITVAVNDARSIALPPGGWRSSPRARLGKANTPATLARSASSDRRGLRGVRHNGKASRRLVLVVG